MLQKIIFSQITEEQKQLLSDFLLQEVATPSKQYWKADHPYTFVYHGKEVSFTLDKSIVRRRRKRNKTDQSEKLGLRFSLLETHLTDKIASYGAMYSLQSIIIQKATPLQIKNKIRIGKFQKHFLPYNPLSRVKNEHRLMKKAGHLGEKEPTILQIDDEDYSFIPMQMMPGVELHDIINADRKPPHNYLSSSMKMKLFLAILKAVKSQIKDKGILHRDLRPMNMLVAMEVNNPASDVLVNIIDFDRSVDLEEKPAADEALLRDPGLDIVNLGIILNAIWDPYFLDQLKRSGDRNLARELQQLIEEMQRGFVVHSMDVKPDLFDAEFIKEEIMENNHGYIQCNKEIFYANYEGKVTKLTISDTSVLNYFPKTYDTVTPLSSAKLMHLIRGTDNFKPQEPVNSKNLGLEECIEKMEKLCTFVVKGGENEAKPSLSLPKTKEAKQEYDFPMAEIGFFSSKKPIQTLAENEATEVPQIRIHMPGQNE